MTILSKMINFAILGQLQTKTLV